MKKEIFDKEKIILRFEYENDTYPEIKKVIFKYDIDVDYVLYRHDRYRETEIRIEII